MSKKVKETKSDETVANVTVADVAIPVETPADNGEFIVQDPLAIRPVDLPLVVKPASGAWANRQQEEFAKVLNAYAYQNPTKWASRKVECLAQLAAIGKDPTLLAVYRGEPDDPSWTNPNAPKAPTVTYNNTAIAS